MAQRILRGRLKLLQIRIIQFWKIWFFLLINVPLSYLYFIPLKNGVASFWINFKNILTQEFLLAQLSWKLKWALLITCCLSSVRKLFTFSSSSPEPLDHFQPNLAQSILGVKMIKNFFLNEGSRPSQSGDNCKKVTIHYWNFLKSSSPEPLGHFHPNLAQSIRFNFFIWRSNQLLKGR